MHVLRTRRELVSRSAPDYEVSGCWFDSASASEAGASSCSSSPSSSRSSPSSTVKGVEAPEDASKDELEYAARRCWAADLELRCSGVENGVGAATWNSVSGGAVVKGRGAMRGNRAASRSGCFSNALASWFRMSEMGDEASGAAGTSPSSSSPISLTTGSARRRGSSSPACWSSGMPCNWSLSASRFALTSARGVFTGVFVRPGLFGTVPEGEGTCNAPKPGELVAASSNSAPKPAVVKRLARELHILADATNITYVTMTASRDPLTPTPRGPLRRTR